MVSRNGVGTTFKSDEEKPKKSWDEITSSEQLQEALSGTPSLTPQNASQPQQAQATGKMSWSDITSADQLNEALSGVKAFQTVDTSNMPGMEEPALKKPQPNFYPESTVSEDNLGGKYALDEKRFGSDQTKMFEEQNRQAQLQATLDNAKQNYSLAPDDPLAKKELDDAQNAYDEYFISKYTTDTSWVDEKLESSKSDDPAIRSMQDARADKDAYNEQLRALYEERDKAYEDSDSVKYDEVTKQIAELEKLRDAAQKEINPYKEETRLDEQQEEALRRLMATEAESYKTAADRIEEMLGASLAKIEFDGIDKYIDGKSAAEIKELQQLFDQVNSSVTAYKKYSTAMGNDSDTFTEAMKDAFGAGISGIRGGFAGSGGWLQESANRLGNYFEDLYTGEIADKGYDDNGVYQGSTERSEARSAEVEAEGLAAADKAYTAAKQELDRRAQLMDEAKNNAGTFQTIASDLVAAGTEMLPDIAVTMLSMGTANPAVVATAQNLALGLMGTRVFGSSYIEAREQGASYGNASLYAGVSAGIEVATEKLFDGLGGLYGKGLSNAADAKKYAGMELTDIFKDKILANISDISKRPYAALGLTLAFGAGGEAIEEGISGALDPMKDAIILDKDTWNEKYGIVNNEGSGWLHDYMVALANSGDDIGYSMLIGGLMGLIGSAKGAVGEYKGEQFNLAAAFLEDDSVNLSDILTDAQKEELAKKGITSDEEIDKIGKGIRDAVKENAETLGVEEKKTTETTENPKTAETSEVPKQETAPVNAEERIAEIDKIADEIEAFQEFGMTEDQILQRLLKEGFAEQDIVDVFDGKAEQMKADAMNAPQAETDAAPAQETEKQYSDLSDSEIEEKAKADANNAKQNNANISGSEASAKTDEITPPAETKQNEDGLTLLNNGADVAETDADAVTKTDEGNEPIPGHKRSQSEWNTLQHIKDVLGGEQEELYYTPITEDETLKAAAARVNDDLEGEMERLRNSDNWSAEDNDTAMLIKAKFQDASAKGVEGAAVTAREWGRLIQEHNTATAQALQSNAKWTRNAAADVAETASINMVDALGEKPSEEKLQLADKTTTDMYSFAAKTDEASSKGDIKALKDIIKQISEYRHTGTLIPSLLDKWLDKIGNTQEDIDYLTKIAKSQIGGIADDFTASQAKTNPKRIGDVLKSMQTMAQLTRLATFERNIEGNTVFSTIDMLAQDAPGYVIDQLVSKLTGKKTVGFEKGWLSKANRKAANKAMLHSALEVALDVDIGANENRYGQTSSRTFKAGDGTGGAASKFFTKWEQLLSYSLTTSDRYFRGGIEASQENALKALKDAGLTDEEIEAVKSGTADYRLFQNKGTAYGVSKGLHDIMNLAGVGGEVNKNNITQGRKGGFGLGDFLNPYPGVPANLGVKPLEYSPANVVKGGAQLTKLLLDAKKGKSIDAAAQNEAVMNIARGMTGTGLAIFFEHLFANGLLKGDDDDDYDKKALDTMQGKSGMQWNLSATQRSMSGEDTKWRDGDVVVNISSIEPVSAFAYVGQIVASEEDAGSIHAYSKGFTEGTVKAVGEIPVMENVSKMFTDFQYSDAEDIGGKLFDVGVNLAGNTAAGFVPAPLSIASTVGDDYYRDTNADTWYGTIGNKIIAKTPLRSLLDTTVDSFGNTKEYATTTGERILNNMLPNAVNRLSISEAEAEINSIYEETGETDFYPSRKAPNGLQFGGERITLSDDEKKQYQTTYGNAYLDGIEHLMETDEWKSMSATEKREALNNIKSYASYLAKKEYAEANGKTYSNSTFDGVDEYDDVFGKVAFDTGLKSSFMNNSDITVDKAVTYLTKYGEMDEDEAREQAQYWGYLREHSGDATLGKATQGDVTAMYAGEISEKEMGAIIDARDSAKEWGANGTVGDNKNFAEIDKFIKKDFAKLSEEAKAHLSTGSYARLDDLYAASQQGIGSETYYAALAKYKEFADNVEGEKQSVNAAEFKGYLSEAVKSGELTQEQADWLQDNMKYYTMSPASASKYEPLSEGLDNEKTVGLIREISNLEPEEGEDEVTNAQKYTAIINSEILTTEEKAFALETYGTSKRVRTQFSGAAQAAKAAGITSEQAWSYVMDFNAYMKEHYTYIASDGSERVRTGKKDVKAALSKLNIPSSIKKVIIASY